jgi:hypothetical protein
MTTANDNNQGHFDKIEEQVQTSSNTTAETQTTDSAAQNTAERKVEVVIVRHRQLFNLLQSPRQLWRLLLSLFLIIFVVFVGLFFVVMTIKHYYPYNKIVTNEMGATIMQDEDKEVIYWLFNTADLWANSGIEVKEGDVLTIQTSGATHTAIHHLLDAAKHNTQPDESWYLPEGYTQETQSDTGICRHGYRLAGHKPTGIFLMQILDAEDSRTLSELKSKRERTNISKEMQHVLTPNYFYVIGQESRELRINKDGVLHFAVNDVVLTDSIIDKMWCDNFKYITGEDYKEIAMSVESVNKTMLEKVKNTANIDFKKQGLKLGYAPNDQDSTYYPLYNELNYYKSKGFFDAWYVDNVGSFLVVIERKAQK